MTTSRPVSGLHRELDVAAAGVHADLAQHRDADIAHVLVFAVGQGHRGRDGDRVAGVHAHRVDVLDRADHHDVVVAVAHEFELVLFPAEHALLDQHLVHRGFGEAAGREPVEFLVGVGQAGAEAAHGEGGADDDRQTEVGDGLADLVHGLADRAARYLAADGADDVLEPLPVLAPVDGLDVGADQFDVVPLQHAAFGQRDRGVERGLAAEGGQDGVGAFAGDHLLDELGGDRLDVGGVGELRVGHDRGRVGVDQRHPQALAAQHAAGLGAGVVEFAGLADHDRTGADDQDVLDVGALGHQRLPPFWVIRSTNSSNRPAASWGPAAASGWYWTENAGASRQRRPSTVLSLGQ